METFWNLPSLLAAIGFFLVLAAWFLFRRWRKTRAGAPTDVDIEGAPAADVPDKPGRYPAMVFCSTGIEFQKLSEKLGVEVYLEPSMPQHGFYSLCVQKTDPATHMVVTEAYDPRDTPIRSEETPQTAYEAIRWPEVGEVYQYTRGIMEHINTILIGLFMAGAFIVMMVAIDKFA